MHRAWCASRSCNGVFFSSFFTLLKHALTLLIKLSGVFYFKNN